MAAPGDLLLKSWKKPWGQTQWVLIWIIALCGVGILLLVQFGIVSRAALPGFLTWAFLSSLASFLAGRVLGFVCGLPSVPVLAPASASASAAGAAGAGATAGSDAAGGAIQPGPPTR